MRVGLSNLFTQGQINVWSRMLGNFGGQVLNKWKVFLIFTITMLWHRPLRCTPRTYIMENII